MDPKNFRNSSSGKVIRTPKGYWAFVPAPLPPEFTWSSSLVSALAEAERHLSSLATLGATLPSPYILVQPFMRQEAVISSRIEGTRASLTDLYAYETTQLSFLKPTADTLEVHNYVRAMDYGLERLNSLPISLRLIREIHQILMEGVRGERCTPGQFRRSQNFIGPPGCTLETAAYVPPPVEEMLTALDNLEKFIHISSDLPLLARTALIHYQFEAIHPFLDGNGRVGRLLIILMLCEWGLLPQPLLNLSAFFESNRSLYYDYLLEGSQFGHWEKWLIFFLDGVSSQSIQATVRIKRLLNLRDSYHELIRDERAANRLFMALDTIFARPILTIRQMEDQINIPYRTAQRYIERFCELGILHEITGQMRNRVYRADEILKAILEPIGEN